MQSSEDITINLLGEKSSASARLLLVGKSDALRQEWRDRLSGTHWTLREAQSGTEALEKLMEESSELMLLDPDLPDLHADEFEAMVRADFPGLQIILLAPKPAPSSPATASTSTTTDEFGSHHRVTLRAGALSPSRASLQGSTGVQSGWYELSGSSPAMQHVYRAARLVARRDTTVLIQGESGTGKDLLARSLHAASARDKQPFVVINCAAIPEALLEAELFGYTKGAFTGAAQSRIGRIHAAHGGTLFLDEIGDMPFPLQSKILRFLEQGEVQRIGGTDTLKVDCRVIAATNADLKKLVKTNQFREDLYYRLAIFPVLLPALRERMDDLDELVSALIATLCPGYRLSSSARQMLRAHTWPGNVRELRNVLERASLFAEDRREIQVDDIFF